MSARESPLLDATSMGILETGYLLRPRTRDELAAALTASIDDLDERLDALAAAGFVEVDGGGIRFESPYATFVAIGRERARLMAEETERTTALMQALPALIRARDLSEVEEGGEHPLAVNIIHALADAGESWFRHASAEEPTSPSLVFPEASALTDVLASGDLVDLQSRLSAGNVRVLLDANLIAEPPLHRAIEAAMLEGVLFRRSRHIESWMYVDAGSIVGVPILWGSGRPTSMLAIRTPPVVAAIALLFERLWERAEPWGGSDASWAPVLGLLAQGLTDDAIADALAITTRTVRRRIAEAMLDLGATSRFTLGAEWSARRG